MLILTRRVGETIKIGADVDVTLMAIDGGQVRLGISAPAHIRIDREEIAQKRIENPRHDQARG